MKILFLSFYYPDFLRSFYNKYGGEVKDFNYQQHRQRLLDQFFGDSSFYSDGVKENGHEAQDIIVNDEILQKKWAREHGFDKFSKTDFLPKLKYLKLFFRPDWSTKILEAQINDYNPDVLYFHDIEYFNPYFLSKLRKLKKFIITQKASPIRKMWCFKFADLVFTSFPHFVPIFRKQGINSEYLKLAFGKKILKAIPKQRKIYNCTFVGGISREHSRGLELLSKASKKVRIDLFGYGKEELKNNSTMYKRHHGEVWGKEMYTAIMKSQMTINRHIDVAKNYANNMRLYEATGSGTMLLTDHKDNLDEIFKVGKEVVNYYSADDLIEKIRYYSSHPRERNQIAKAGQKRTLKDHNFKVRMREAINIIKNIYER